MFAQIPVLFIWVGFGAIGVLAMILVIMFIKMGPAGRFWLKHNLFKGNSPVLLAMTHTNALKHFSVIDDGQNLRWGRDRFVFLPDLSRRGRQKDQVFNEISKKTGHIDGKPVFLGTVSASVACNPHLAETVAVAKKGGHTQLTKFLETVNTTYAGKVRNIHMLNQINIKDIAEIMNIVITPNRLKTVFDFGEIKGRNIVKTKETMLFIIIFALLATVLGLAYMITRA